MFTEHIYEFLILIGLILIMIDFFIPTDVPSIVAHGLFAYCIVHAIDAPVLYSVIIGISAWLLMIGLHYKFFKHVIAQFSNRFIAKTVINEDPMNRLVGKTVKVETVAGKQMIRLEGDLIPFEDSEEYTAGTSVKVESFQDGVAVVTPN